VASPAMRPFVIILKKKVFKLADFTISICILIAFFCIGKLISKTSKPLLKKYTKAERHKNATDIMVNNYWGNMISMTGAAFICGRYLGITNISFFFAADVLILIAYVLHITNASGESIDQAISIVLNGNNKSLLQYMHGTICAILALLAAGFISCNVVAPIVFSDSKKPETVESQKNNPENNIPDINKEREEEFQKIIEEAFH